MTSRAIPAGFVQNVVRRFQKETEDHRSASRSSSGGPNGAHNRLSVIDDPDPAAGSYTMNIGSGNCTITAGIPGTPIDDADRAMNQYTATPTDLRGYDRDGNLTSLKNDTTGSILAVSCLYDYRDRMVEYRDSVSGQRHTYAYDALSRRIAKTVDADGASPTTTRYFYGGESQWQVCEEQNATGNTTATYVYGRYIDEVLQMQRCEDGAFPPCNSVSPVDYYYHTDGLYNVMAVTDSAGSVVERYEYDDYGTPTIMDAADNALTLSDGTPLTSSPIANPYLFTGRRYDPEFGWYNYRTRYLDPAAGRFTTRDVIGIWGDPMEFGNGYAYVGNNPLVWLDPYGESIVFHWRPSWGHGIGHTTLLTYTGTYVSHVPKTWKPANNRTFKDDLDRLGWPDDIWINWPSNEKAQGDAAEAAAQKPWTPLGNNCIGATTEGTKAGDAPEFEGPDLPGEPLRDYFNDIPGIHVTPEGISIAVIIISILLL